MRLYLDVCCYSRLYDDQTQVKIYFEKACAKLDLKIKVSNPLKYLLEVIQDDSNT